MKKEVENNSNQNNSADNGTDNITDSTTDSISKLKGRIDIDFKKIAEIASWEKQDDETYEELFFRMGKNINQLPSRQIIDIVHAGGLQEWAGTLKVNSQHELFMKLRDAANRTINDPVFDDKKNIEAFKKIKNFYILCNDLDKHGKLDEKMRSIAEYEWNTSICRRNLNERTKAMFSQEPDKQRYKEVSEKIKDIWGFTNTDLDAIRYFVCQTRHENHNPSMNKGIYFWGRKKQTGKTTIARMLVTILNGDKFENFGQYESTLNTEMQYNDHDIPAAAMYNAILLDESMPKDATKSYGLVKQMLTSNMCKYNQKFGAITRIPCKRNYVWTSNDDVMNFVQDDVERRFYDINIEKEPKRLEFSEIYDIWKEFCVNCEPEDNWQDWYNSFKYVNGIASKEAEDIENEIILRRDEIFKTYSSTYITARQIANMLIKGNPSRQEMNTIRLVMDKLFSSCRLVSNKAYYNSSRCLQIANEMKSNIDLQESLVSDDETYIANNENDLPF